MKNKKLILVLMALTICSFSNVKASSGALGKDTIKTCPDGKTYGQHSSDNHWHEAKFNGKQYYPDGDAIYSDPCQESTSQSSNEVIVHESPSEEIEEQAEEIISEKTNKQPQVEETLIIEPAQQESTTIQETTPKVSTPPTSKATESKIDNSDKQSNNSNIEENNTTGIEETNDELIQENVTSNIENNDKDKNNEIAKISDSNSEENNNTDNFINGILGSGVVIGGSGTAYYLSKRKK